MLFKKILKYKKVYAAMFIWALFLGCLPLNAIAMPIASKAGFSKSYQNDLQTISRFLEKETVAKRLSGLGLSSEQIKARLSSLDSQQIHNLAQRVESIEKASGAGLAIAVLAILLLTISFLYFTNRRITVQKTYE